MVLGNNIEKFENIMEQPLVKLSDINDEIKELLKQTLNIVPEERPTAEELFLMI